jgi:cob(I)alamin adenosyltransferase
MVRLDRIYTRTGDDGTTALGNGRRVPKHDPRVEAYGTVDELNAALGLLAGALKGRDRALVIGVQNDLFDAGADLCVPPGDSPHARRALRVTGLQVARLEREITSSGTATASSSRAAHPGVTGGPAHPSGATTNHTRRARATAVRIVTGGFHHGAAVSPNPAMRTT